MTEPARCHACTTTLDAEDRDLGVCKGCRTPERLEARIAEIPGPMQALLMGGARALGLVPQDPPTVHLALCDHDLCPFKFRGRTAEETNDRAWSHARASDDHHSLTLYADDERIGRVIL